MTCKIMWSFGSKWPMVSTCRLLHCDQNSYIDQKIRHKQVRKTHINYISAAPPWGPCIVRLSTRHLWAVSPSLHVMAALHGKSTSCQVINVTHFIVDNWLGSQWHITAKQRQRMTAPKMPPALLSIRLSTNHLSSCIWTLEKSNFTNGTSNLKVQWMKF